MVRLFLGNFTRPWILPGLRLLAKTLVSISPQLPFKARIWFILHELKARIWFILDELKGIFTYERYLATVLDRP